MSQWELHDAILERVTLDWAAARVSIEVTTRDGAATIVGDGVIMLRCPRREPWGPSRHINGVSGPGNIYAGSDVFALEIEMQSGDKLELEARTIELRR
jgi:hypothetical protein